MSVPYGYVGRVLRIDLSDRKFSTEALDKEDAVNFLGGRGLNSRRLFEEVESGIDPLGEENKLMIATGPLVGTMFPTASRFNVSAKSPLTGILGDSNAGGHFASEMKFAGYDQIIIEGRSSEPVYIHIQDYDVELRNASNIVGKNVYKTDAFIKKDVGDSYVQTLIAGPAAEKGVKFAGLFANLVRAASRTGMGTVLASKGVKAIAVRGKGNVSVAYPIAFEKLVLKLEEEIRNHEQYPGRRLMGTTRILMMANEAGFLPTRNYTSGVFEYAEEVSGEKLAAEYNVKSRGCFACTIPCSRVFVVKEGEYAGLCGEGPEYESLGSFSSRIGNKDINLALKANDLCNKLGLDALTTAGAIAWAMELWEKDLLSGEETNGLQLNWGNKETILTLIKQIAERRGFGEVLADGTHKAAEKLGKGTEYAMHVKGMDLIMADPRGVKGFGLGYSVSSRGGDHLRSEPFIELSDDPNIGKEKFGVAESTLRLADKGKGKLVAYFENWNAVIDSLEVCKNIMQNMELLDFERASKALLVSTGLKLTSEEVRLVGERIINIERAFLVREGVTRKDDYLPKRFIEEVLQEGKSKGTSVNMKTMLDEYYLERGWDINTGIPLRSVLEKLELKYVADELRV
jgi:aldehyde:ferredoxin oxidoreductase